MIVREGSIIKVEGVVNVDNVTALTAQGTALLDNQCLSVDLAAVGEIDSSVVSMLLEWLRVAKEHNCQIQFINQPQSLKSLVQLYGVAEFISPATVEQVEEVHET